MNKPALIVALALASTPAMSSQSRAQEPRPSGPVAVMPTRRIPPLAVQTAIQNLREACLAWTPTIASGEEDRRPLLVSELEGSDLCQAATEMTTMQTKMAMVGGVIALVVLLLASGVLGFAVGIFRRVRHSVSPRLWGS